MWNRFSMCGLSKLGLLSVYSYGYPFNKFKFKNVCSTDKQSRDATEGCRVHKAVESGKESNQRRNGEPATADRMLEQFYIVSTILLNFQM